MPTNSSPTYIVSGRITNLQNVPLEGLVVRVYAWRPNASAIPLAGEMTTSADGKYQITFAGQQAADDEDGKVAVLHIMIRVFADKKFLGKSQAKQLTKRRLNIDLKLDHQVPEPNEPEHKIQGMVRDALGNPLPDIPVRAFDRYLRTEHFLGEDLTNSKGHYEISYSAEKFRARKKENTDLVVKAFDDRVTSPILFSAPPVAELDLIIPEDILPSLSLFERIMQVLIPQLGGLKVTKLVRGAKHATEGRKAA
jgi:hypothetical protein